MVQLVSTSACHAEGHGFESRPSRLDTAMADPITYNGRLAQLGERLPYKQDVTGSSPVVTICLFLPSRQRGSIGRAADL